MATAPRVVRPFSAPTVENHFAGEHTSILRSTMGECFTPTAGPEDRPGRKEPM